MGLLDFDDKEILRKRGIIPTDKPKRVRYKDEYEAEANFSELQNMGHERNSADFSDSMFADRQPTVITSFPGQAVDRHLKKYGHLPELGCCEFDQPDNTI